MILFKSKSIPLQKFFFRNIRNQVNLLIEKIFLTSSIYLESPSNFLTNPTLRIFLMWPKMILPPNPIQKFSLHFSNIPNKILPLLHLYTNTILSIRTTPRKALFLMNSSNLCLVGSTDADRSMLDITVTSKGIEKLLSNLNPHKDADPDLSS